MLKIVRASTLIFVMACSASAGDTPNNVTGTPTQAPAPSAPEPTSPTSGAGPSEKTADSFGETLLNLLENVLALF
ncbi:MAG TPA: hypothetical protein VG148_15530 [Pyrinomonadaceae bacterium]|nr:hypothetical protein [Pyrinomonadaceae bacterium]